MLAEVGTPDEFGDLALAPDEKRAAVTLVGGATQQRDVWLVDLSTGERTKFTFDPAPEQAPVWSSDSTRLVFGSRRHGGILNLYEKPASGGDVEREVLVDSVNKNANSWSSDGRFLLYTDVTGGPTGNDIWALDLASRKSIARAADTLQRRRRAILAGRALDCVSIERIRTPAGVREALSRTRRAMAGVVDRWKFTALAGGWAGNFLRLPQRPCVDVGRSEERRECLRPRTGATPVSVQRCFGTRTELRRLGGRAEVPREFAASHHRADIDDHACLELERGRAKLTVPRSSVPQFLSSSVPQFLSSLIP